MTDSARDLHLRQWRVSSEEVSLFVRSIGGERSSTILVLVHGGPALSHHYMEALEVLADEGSRVVNYDQRGSGASTEAAADGYGLPHHVADLEAVRGSLGAERIHVLGHSWGGLVAMAYALECPRRIASLILVDSIPPTSAGLVAAHRRFHARQERLVGQGRLAAPLPVVEGDDCMPRFLALLPVYFSDPTRCATPELLRTTCRERVGRFTWENTFPYDLTAGLTGLDVPCLIIQGKGDPFGVEMAEEIRSALHAAAPRWMVLEGCGHFPWIEQPAIFFDILRRFLASPQR